MSDFPEFPWPEGTIVSQTTRRSFEVTVEGHQRAIREIGKAFTSPEDDWTAILILDSETERAIIPVQNFMSDKDLLAQAFIPIAILQTDAWCASFVTSGWAVKAEMEEHQSAEEFLEAVGKPSEHPDRQEVITLTVFTVDEEVAYLADIKRTESEPPTLGEFFKADESEGRFSMPIRAALLTNHLIAKAETSD